MSTMALTDGRQTLNANARAAQAAQVSSLLHDAVPRIRVLALVADNGLDWIVVDRAAAAARTVLVPLPAFFTQAQTAHALAVSGADYRERP